MSLRHHLLPVAALLALFLVTPASAAMGPRIVNGTEVTDATVYPAQGYLEVDKLGPFVGRCGGTLVGTRQFLTAARCVIDDAAVLERFSVTLGELNLDPPNSDVYGVADVDFNPGYTDDAQRRDVAMLTLDRPAVGYEVTRVVGPDDTGLWTAGTTATILGWGKPAYGSGAGSNLLLAAEVPIRTDAACNLAYEAFFDPGSMVCAGAADPAHGSSDSCDEDWGGPLLVADGGPEFFALAGVFSTGFECNRAGFPGIYARIGADPLNAWVHSRTPEADFDFDPRDRAPLANVPAKFMSTSRHPEGPGYFTGFRWDFDGNGSFETPSTGKTVTHTFPTAGRRIVGLEVSKPGGDKASIYYAFDVGADPSAPPGGPGSGGQTIITPPPTAVVKPAAPLAAISSAKRPKVGPRGRFTIRVRFARTAPRGIAVIEVFRAKRKIGIARTRVQRGGSKRVKVKLTPTGRRLLRRSNTRRLKVRVRVRVGRTVLRSKTLTIRR